MERKTKKIKISIIGYMIHQGHVIMLLRILLKDQSKHGNVKQKVVLDQYEAYKVYPGDDQARQNKHD